jgi:hypothetical protein
VSIRTVNLRSTTHTPSKEEREAGWRLRDEEQLKRMQNDKEYIRDPIAYVHKQIARKEEMVANHQLLDSSWVWAVGQLRKLHSL